MTNLDQTSLSGAVKTQYERRLLTRAVPRLIHGRWGMVARLNKMGSYELRRYESLSAVTSPLGEAVTPAEQGVMTLTQLTVTPLFYGAWIGHSDELEMTVFDPLLSELSAILGEQAGLSADTLIRNDLTDNATKDYSGGQSARTSLDAPAHNIQALDVIKQIAYLEAKSALPVDGDSFICILHPFTWDTLMLDPYFASMFIQEAPNSPIRSGYVGRLLRTRFYVSANCRSYTDSGVDSSTNIYSMLFIAKESYGYVGMAGITPDMVDNAGPEGGPLTGQSVRPVEVIVKQLGSSGTADPLNQRATVGWKMALATKVLASDWVRDLEHTNLHSDD